MRAAAALMLTSCARISAAPPWVNVMMDREQVDTAGHWPFSEETRRSCWHQAMCKPLADGTCTFKVVGTDDKFHCGVERDTQRQVWWYLPPDSVVLEIGSRFGTVSCTISKRQHYSGMRVSVEPDRHAFDRLLNVNVAANGCAGQQVWGVVDAQNASLPKGGSYSELAAPDARGEIPAYSVAALERTLPRLSGGAPPRFSALFIDCEGCGFRFIETHEAFLRSPWLQLVFLEADSPGGSQTGYWKRYVSDLFPKMCGMGFDLLAVDPNLTGHQWLFKQNPMYHVVFQKGGRCAANDKRLGAMERRERNAATSPGHRRGDREML